MTLKALIFDVDGTLADTEEAHRLAFNATFKDFGYDWSWDQTLYEHLLSVTGGKLRIRFFLETHDPALLEHDDIDNLIAKMHLHKTGLYVAAINTGDVPLRPGVERLFREARDAGVVISIATTTTPINVEALIKNNLGAEAMDWFDAIGASDCCENLKPAPDVYLWVIDKLGLEAKDCLALEDSANGVKAAVAADLAVLVTTNHYTRNHDFTGAAKVVADLSDVTLADLQAMHSS